MPPASQSINTGHIIRNQLYFTSNEPVGPIGEWSNVFTATSIPLFSLLIFALLANVPLGYLRENSRRYSLRWFVYLHLSIPFLVVLRYSLGFGWGIVPFSVGCAVAGQMIGGRIRRRTAP